MKRLTLLAVATVVATVAVTARFRRSAGHRNLSPVAGDVLPVRDERHAGRLLQTHHAAVPVERLRDQPRGNLSGELHRHDGARPQTHQPHADRADVVLRNARLQHRRLQRSAGGLFARCGKQLRLLADSDRCEHVVLSHQRMRSGVLSTAGVSDGRLPAARRACAADRGPARPDRRQVVRRQGPAGRPKLYAEGQPIRNAFRTVLP